MKRTCQYVILALWLVLGPLGVDGLRRHRHRRDEESELNAEQKENKHKPKFERCDDYHFSVLEESNAGKKDTSRTGDFPRLKAVGKCSSIRLGQRSRNQLSTFNLLKF